MEPIQKDMLLVLNPPSPAQLAATPVAPLAADWVYLRSIGIDAAHKLLKRRKRDRKQVERDYEAGDWQREQDEAAWLLNPTLQDYADRAHLDRMMQVTIGSQLHRMHVRDYYRYRRTQLASIMEQFARDEELVVELGSGTGAIIYELLATLPQRRFLGLDLSQRGIDVARTVAEHYGVANAAFDQIDLLDGSSPGYAHLKGRTVFSHYCLEQLPRETERIFRNVIAAGAKRYIMVEPTFELLNRTSLRDLATWSYVLRQDYQRSIIRTASKLAGEGLIRIVEQRRLDFVSSHRHFATLLVFDRA